MPSPPHRRRKPLPASSSSSRLAPHLLLLLLLPYYGPRPAHSLREALYACPNPDAAPSEGICPSSSGRDSPSSDRAAEMADDEQTLLDLFGEVAKEVLTKHVIPPTDAVCDWDWGHARCEPYCDCHFRPMWGDFHLGRSCRLRLDVLDGSDDGNDGEDDGDNGGKERRGRAGTCQLPPDTPYVKAFRGVAHTAKIAAARAQRVARIIAEKAHVRERLGNVKGRTCTSWEERVNYDGRDMKQWQKKFCGLAGEDPEEGIELQERQSMRKEFVSHVRDLHDLLQDDDGNADDGGTADSTAADEKDERQSVQENSSFGRVHQQIKEDKRASFGESDEQPPPQFEGQDDMPPKSSASDDEEEINSANIMQ